LTGSSHAFEASSFFNADGPPPDIGQSFMLIDPDHFAGPAFANRLEVLLSAIGEQPGTRVPGVRRLDLRKQHTRDGIEVEDGLLDTLRRRAA